MFSGKKGNFPKCCRCLPSWTGAELVKNIWFSRVFLCGSQGCFLVVSPGDFSLFCVSFPHLLPSTPALWRGCFPDEGIRNLSFLNLKWLIRGALMPEVIHDVGIPHGELGLVSTLLWAFQGSASLDFVLQYPIKSVPLVWTQSHNSHTRHRNPTKIKEVCTTSTAQFVPTN